MSDLLVNSEKGHLSASQRIPAIARPFVSDRAAKTLDLVGRSFQFHILSLLLIIPLQVEKFVEEECIPADAVFVRQIGDTTQERFSSHPPVLEDLKTKAQQIGLWNMFLPKNHFKEGAGFSNLEYGLMAEYLGKSRVASEATNCAAPDTGNMEVLAKYGNEQQKKRWLEPLLQGKIRSAFLMTEPQVASSDATNIEMTITRDGDHYVLNGQKWWSSGIGDPRCEIYIVLGKTDPKNSNKYVSVFKLSYAHLSRDSYVAL